MSVHFNSNNTPAYPDKSTEIQNAIDLVQKDGMAIGSLSEDLRNHPVIASHAFRQNPEAKAFFGDKLKSNRIFLHSLVTKGDCSILAIADPRLTDDQNFMEQMVQINGLALQYAGERLRGDVELVRLAVLDNRDAFQFATRALVLRWVQADGLMLKLASPALRDDPEIVEAATNQRPYALRYASRRLVLMAVEIDGRRLEYASREDRNDVEIVSAAIQQDPAAIQFALKDAIFALVPRENGKFTNREAVLALVKQDGLLFQEASDELQTDSAIVREAIRQNWTVLPHVEPELRDHPTIVDTTLLTAPRALQFFGRTIVLEQVRQNADLFEFASQEHRNDPEIARLAIEKKRSLIQYAGREAILNLVEEDPWFIPDVSLEYRDDREIMRAAIVGDGVTFKYASPRLRDDLELAKIAVTYFPKVIQYASRRVVLRLLGEVNGLFLAHAGPTYQNDDEAVLAAVRQNGKARQFTSKLLKGDEKFMREVDGLFPGIVGFAGA